MTEWLSIEKNPKPCYNGFRFSMSAKTTNHKIHKLGKKLKHTMKNHKKQKRKKHLIFFTLWGLFGVVLLCDFVQYFASKKQNLSNFVLDRDAQPHIDKLATKPIFFDVPNSAKSAHASAIVNIERLQLADKNNTTLTNMLLYFAGSREGASDVCIYQSFFSPPKPYAKSSDKSRTKHLSENPQKDLAKDKGWSEPRAILCPNDLSKMAGKFIKKLGNPVSFIDAKGRVHLFVVGVSMGGWATSKIYWAVFDRELSSLNFVRELHLSPILNLSHLVRNPAMILDNGGFVLPIYNEFAQKYPLLLEINGDYEVLSTQKPFYKDLPRNQLQPSFVPLDFSKYFGVSRRYGVDSSMKAALCEREKMGKNSCKTLSTNLQNFDSSSVLFRLGDFVFLLHNRAKNAQSKNANNREELWLYKLQDFDIAKSSLENHLGGGQVNFKPIERLDELEGKEVSYPSVAINSEFVHISYTYGREHIRTLLLPKSHKPKSHKKEEQ